MPAETHSHREVSTDDVRRVVFEHTAEQLGKDVEDVRATTPLPMDAGALLALVQLCEDELADRTVGLDADDVTEWRTVGDVVAFLCAGLGVAAAEAAEDRDAGPERRLDALEARTGYRFDDRALLLQSLYHRSFVAENPGSSSNERLEFLGDAVLGIVVTDVLYRRWPSLQEGQLAKARAAVVNSEYLAEAANMFDLGAHLFLGKGEAASGGCEKPSILADAVEAVIGAIYIDGGMEAAGGFVMRIVEDKLDDAVTGEGSKDFKTRLQELAAQLWAQLPVYVVEAHGPDHAKRFVARVEIAGDVHGVGRGRSKKQAEQGAAREALDSLLGVAVGEVGTPGDPEDG